MATIDCENVPAICQQKRRLSTIATPKINSLERGFLGKTSYSIKQERTGLASVDLVIVVPSLKIVFIHLLTSISHHLR
jgi:hypothetical protein